MRLAVLRLRSQADWEAMKLTDQVDRAGLGFREIGERNRLAASAKAAPTHRPPTHGSPIGPPREVVRTPSMVDARRLQVDRLLLGAATMALDSGWPDVAALAESARSRL